MLNSVFVPISSFPRKTRCRTQGVVARHPLCTGDQVSGGSATPGGAGQGLPHLLVARRESGLRWHWALQQEETHQGHLRAW